MSIFFLEEKGTAMARKKNTTIPPGVENLMTKQKTRVPEYNGILELQQLTGEEHTSFCFLSKQGETLPNLLTPH